MSDTIVDSKVLAPNGRLYTARTSGHGRSAYVYVYGKRVYGTVGTPEWNSDHARTVRRFTPAGKWAFLLAPIVTPSNLEDVSIG